EDRRASEDADEPREPDEGVAGAASAFDQRVAALEVDAVGAAMLDAPLGHVHRDEVRRERRLVSAEEPEARVQLKQAQREAALVVLEREVSEELRARATGLRVQQTRETVAPAQRRAMKTQVDGDGA